MICAFLTLCGLAAFALGNVIIAQLRSFLSELMRNIDSPRNLLRAAFDFAAEMKDKIPFLADENDENATAISESLYAVVIDTVRSGVQKISAVTATRAASFVKALPRVGLFTAVFAISAFYITVDYEKIADFIHRTMNEKTYDALMRGKRRFALTLIGCMKAYSLIMLVSFTELYAGFLVINVKYPLVLAIVIAAVDVLPVIGAGSVLVPWALISFASGDYVTAWGVGVIFCVMYVIRQIVESKIVGTYIGIHPIAALMSMYISCRILGIAGMIAGPIAALSLKLILTSREHE